MLFNYDHDNIKTTDELKISVADLRDLIQASGLPPKQMQAEFEAIIEAIGKKNRLPAKSIQIKLDNN